MRSGAKLSVPPLSSTPLALPPPEGFSTILAQCFAVMKASGGELRDIAGFYGVSITLLACVWASSRYTLPLSVPLALTATTVFNAYSAILYGLYFKYVEKQVMEKMILLLFIN